MRPRMWVVWITLFTLVGGSDFAFAQDNQSAEQLKKMYQDVLQQLNASQERKNQLAAENERLVQQLDALNKEKASLQQRLEELKRSDADHLERMLFLRSHYMVWQQFTASNPEVEARWRAYIESDFLTGPGSGVSVLEKTWIFSNAHPPEPATQPTTQPGTQPASHPATTQVASTQPASTQPAATQPSPTQPITTQSAATQPAATQSAATQPAATQPAAEPTTRPATPPTQPAAPAPEARPAPEPSPAPPPGADGARPTP